MLEAIGQKSEDGPRSRILRWGGSAAIGMFAAGPVLPALGAASDVTLGVMLALGAIATVLFARGMREGRRSRWQ